MQQQPLSPLHPSHAQPACPQGRGGSPWITQSFKPFSSSPAHHVISEVKAPCFRVLRDGRCSLPTLRNITKQICCCSRVGKAWGWGCQHCPPFGSGEAPRALPHEQKLISGAGIKARGWGGGWDGHFALSLTCRCCSPARGIQGHLSSWARLSLLCLGPPLRHSLPWPGPPQGASDPSAWEAGASPPGASDNSSTVSCGYVFGGTTHLDQGRPPR